MNRTKVIALLLAVLLLPAGVAGAITIGSNENTPINRRIDRNTAKTLAYQPEAAKARTDSLVIGVTDLPGEINPFFVATMGDDYAASLMFDELLFTNNAGEIGAGVASYTQSADGRTYTFTVNEKAKYVDGAQVLAADYVNALYLLLTPGFDGAYDISRAGIEGVQAYLDGEAQEISGIAITGERTFTVTMEIANPANLIFLAVPALRVSLFGEVRRPADITETGDFAAYYTSVLERVRETDATGMAYGQYILTSAEKGVRAVFEKNSAYWRGEPYIGTMELLVVRVGGEVNAILNGDVDIIGALGSVDSVDAVVDFEKGFVNLYTWEGDVIGYLLMDLEDERFADQSVRQALAMGFDREAARQKKLERYGPVPNVLLFDNFSANVSHMYEEQFPYDFEGAGKILEQAGWILGEDGIRYKDGKPFKITLTYSEPNPVMEVVLMQMQIDFHDLGIGVSGERVSFEELVERVDAGEYEMAFQARRLPSSAALSADYFAGDSHLNMLGSVNDTLDRFLAMATLEASPERQTVVYEVFFQELYAEMPFIPLYRRSEFLLANARVMNLTITTAHDITADAYRLFLTDTLEGQW